MYTDSQCQFKDPEKSNTLNIRFMPRHLFIMEPAFEGKAQWI